MVIPQQRTPLAPRADDSARRNPDQGGRTAAEADSPSIDEPDTGARNDDTSLELPSDTGSDLIDEGGDEETADGLNASDEAIRHAAEDLPEDEDAPDSIPVFERGDLPPKL